MPNYANIPLYKKGLRATQQGREVTGVLDPEKRYDLEFTTQQIPRSQVSPEECAGAIREDIAPEQPTFPEWDYANINDRAEYDYQTGQLAVQNQYLEDMKAMNQLQPGSPQHITLSQWAASKFQSEMAELESNKQKWRNARRRINQDPRVNRRTRSGLERDFYSKNPIYEPEEIELDIPKEPSRGRPLAASRLDDMADRAVDMAAGLESWKPFVGTSKENIIKAVKASADMAGWKNLNTATKEALFATLDVKLKNTGETEDKWDEDAARQIREYIGLEKSIPIPEAEYPEPLTQEVFESAVGRLKATNPFGAKEYYNRWVSKWR